MSSLGSLNIQLSLDTVQFQQALSKSDHQTQKFVKNFTVDMDKARNSARQFADRTTDYLRNIEEAAKNINTATKWEFRFNNFERLKSLATSYVDIADKSTELSNKLKLVTDDELQHARAMADVYDISMKTAQSTQAVSSVYQSFAQNAKELGINQRQVADVTEIISKAVAISGASASEAQNALTQFSQTLLMGKMRAQEYNSIMTQTPAVMQAIARGLGVTMGELKAMSDEGKLTTDKMIQALMKSKASVDELYGKTATTVSGAMQNLTTATEKFIGEVDKTTGVSTLAATGINTLAQNLDNLIPLLFYAGTAFAGMKLQAFTAQTWQLVHAKVQDVRTTTDQAQKILFKTQARSQEVTQELKATQAYIANLQAQMNLARTEQQRAIIARELQVQTQRETTLVQQQTVAIKALETAQNQANIAKRAGLGLLNALGGPWGIAMGLVSSGAMALYNWYQEAEQAKQKAIEFANALPRLKEELATMNGIDLRATKAQLEESAEAQQKKVDDLKRKVKSLRQEIESTPPIKIIEDDEGREYQIDQTHKIIRLQRELDKTTKDLNDSENTLNETKKTISDTMAQMPIAEIRDRFAELFPNIDQSQIKTDGLNVSLGGFISNIPVASVEALRFAGAVGQIATSAVNAAVAVANLAGIQVGNEKLNLHIANNQALIDINKAQASGNTKLANELRAQFNAKNKAESLGVQQGTKEWEALVNSELALLNSSPKGGGRSGSPKPKKDKAAEKSREDYLNQVTDMTLRLAGLKDDALNLAQNGELSQYQELNKLTEDIARNTEKYTQYGIEGVAKLKELAAQIDSENQKVAIAKFSFDNREKLKEMEFELTLLGKTRQEQEALQYAHQLDLEASRLKIGMTKENAAALEQEIIKLKERHAEIQRQTEAARQNPVIGLRAGLADFAEEATNVSGQIQNIVTGSLNSMTDALNTFVMTGKADFRSLATSILSDINKMIIKMMIFKAIQSAGSAMGFDMSFMKNISFATGGYTGDGGKYTPAGIVHKGEYVITKEATSRLGLDYLNYLNYGKRGFATGGGVAVPRVPNSYKPAQTGGANNQVSISINIDQNGNAESDVSQTAQQSKQLAKMIEAKVLDVLFQQKRSGNLLA
ncbi:phage tape measure protein [Actinobacillus minor NM305]|uniref:Phage tape measure protein n=2 Tax=Actinobacillus minor TaxID=51047 RepID=C5S5C2_9PAST|nr:phage tail tape measure protein [Actinobacillus minor]EER45908.1 phage tape measure protein [Actinobacillus minor NM305]